MVLLQASEPARGSAGDGWMPLADSPLALVGPISVWTGSEMLSFGLERARPQADYVLYGLRYAPASDRWTEVSRVGIPSPRGVPPLVWTGSEALVWGGFWFGGPLDDGARYDPVEDSWRPITRVAAPSARTLHTAVWTGREMIVWGGQTNPNGRIGAKNDGARYDPDRDQWSPMSQLGAPSPRAEHTAVWTGTAMLVWGGHGPDGSLADGARYDPISDTWSPISPLGAPAPRAEHAAVWTGAEMLIWGGAGPACQPDVPPPYCGSGARYDPDGDSWRPMSAQGAPSPRIHHRAVWTGSEMLVVGGGMHGRGVVPIAGWARYSPTADRWLPLRDESGPARRSWPSAIWTGQELLLWGGIGDLPVGPSGLGARGPLRDAWRYRQDGSESGSDPGPRPAPAQMP